MITVNKCCDKREKSSALELCLWLQNVVLGQCLRQRRHQNFEKPKDNEIDHLLTSSRRTVRSNQSMVVATSWSNHGAVLCGDLRMGHRYISTRSKATGSNNEWINAWLEHKQKMGLQSRRPQDLEATSSSRKQP